MNDDKVRLSTRKSKDHKSELLSGEWDGLRYRISAPAAPTKLYSPEEKLMLAVIGQAVEDATSNSVPPVVRDQARAIIFHPSATNLKDFCLFLEIDYAYFRESVARMIKEGRTLARNKL